jgi:ubiquinone/menaquinone biosynthesis C-methylase UbiE
MKLLRFIFLFVVGSLAVALGWRRISRNHSVPCPTLLAGFLENPVVDKLAGTQLTLDYMGLRPGQRVLEIGPGPGRLLIPAAQRVAPNGEVFGLDIQPGMLARLKTNAARAGVTNLTAMLGDATQAVFSPESFDVIYLSTVLGEIPDREAALRQCYAALKPGGTLSITEMMPDPHYQTQEMVQQLAEGAGFRPQAAYGPWYRFTANFIKPA